MRGGRLLSPVTVDEPRKRHVFLLFDGTARVFNGFRVHVRTPGGARSAIRSGELIAPNFTSPEN